LAIQVGTAATVAKQTAAGMHKFYGLAKRQAWDVRDLSWGKISPIPEGNGSEIKRERRRAVWRSVLTQQLQADELAAQVSTDLLATASDVEAKLYYSTMAQDEARHFESWLKLADASGGTCEPDPYLAELGKFVLSVDTVEEKVWLLQVAFEGLVIPRFHQIAAAAPDTILAEICNKLAIDDGIHHGAGVYYEKLLLSRATPKARRDIEKASLAMWPMYIQHLQWRPRERAWASDTMHSRDTEMIRGHRETVYKLANELNLNLDLTY